MNTIIFANKGNVRMIAHRGVSGLETENTCPAFVVAGVKSYYGIETDVHVTKDGKYVVIHDSGLGRVSGGVELSVEGSTLEQLRAVPLMDKHTGKPRGDLFTPTLEEYLTICRKYDKQAVLELKKPLAPENIWEIAEIVIALGWMERTTFISFEGSYLVALREKFPEADAQFLTNKVDDETIAFLKTNDLDADLWFGCLTAENVARLHAEGIHINCWTVDQLEDAKRLRDLGVDFITTNILE